MTLPANISSLVTSIEQTRDRVDSSDAAFLKMQKDGNWCYGTDENEPEAGSAWAVNTQAIMVGFIAWGAQGTKDEGSVVGEEMTLVQDPAILKANLPEVNGKWTPQFALSLKCVEGADEGTTCVYKANSHGAMKEFKRFLDEILKRAKAGNETLIPLVELSNDSYKHSTYGKIYTPVLDIFEWVGFDGTGSEEPAAADPEPVEEPTAAVEPVEEPAAVEEPKTRRRSRRTAS